MATSAPARSTSPCDTVCSRRATATCSRRSSRAADIAGRRRRGSPDSTPRPRARPRARCRATVRTPGGRGPRARRVRRSRAPRAATVRAHPGARRRSSQPHEIRDRALAAGVHQVEHHRERHRVRLAGLAVRLLEQHRIAQRRELVGLTVAQHREQLAERRRPREVGRDALVEPEWPAADGDVELGVHHLVAERREVDREVSAGTQVDVHRRAVVEPGRPAGRVGSRLERLGRGIDDDRQLVAARAAGQPRGLLEQARDQVSDRDRSPRRLVGRAGPARPSDRDPGLDHAVVAGRDRRLTDRGAGIREVAGAGVERPAGAGHARRASGGRGAGTRWPRAWRGERWRRRCRPRGAVVWRLRPRHAILGVARYPGGRIAGEPGQLPDRDRDDHDPDTDQPSRAHACSVAGGCATASRPRYADRSRSMTACTAAFPARCTRPPSRATAGPRESPSPRRRTRPASPRSSWPTAWTSR